MPEPQAFDPADAQQREERLHRFSHELKNRLGSMWQAVNLLAELPEGPDREQVIAMVEKSYFNGARALEALLDDFRVPRGIVAIAPQRVDLGEVLAKSVASIGFRTTGKQQEVRVKAPGPLFVMGDPQVLEQLFEALLSNASKFSQPGGLIELAARLEGSSAVIEVADQGVGLSAADLNELFTRYAVLGSRSTTGESQARGTLARARQWAQVHGGTLTATSAGEGQGSVFQVVLPAA